MTRAVSSGDQPPWGMNACIRRGAVRGLVKKSGGEAGGILERKQNVASPFLNVQLALQRPPTPPSTPHSTTMLLRTAASTSRLALSARPLALARTIATQVQTPDAASTLSELQTPRLSYHVERSERGNLPVYSEYRNGRSNRLTVVRKISGNVGVSCLRLRVGSKGGK